MQKKDIKKLNIVILAAGKGSRMKSNLPKILHKVANRSLFEHVLSSVNEIKVDKNTIVITSNDILNDFKNEMPHEDKKLHYVIQQERLGTGHAVRCAVESKYWKKKNNYTGVFYGDVPFISQETIKKLFNLLKTKYDLVVLGFEPEDQSRPYGRLFTEKDLRIGQNCDLYQIKEFKDLPREKPRLCNSGIMVGKTEIFCKLLPQIKNNNKAKEYYLTDIVELANENGYKIGTYICDEFEVIGVNSRMELSHAERLYQKKLQEKHLANGATLLNKESVYFSYDTKIGQDVIIEPNVFFGKNVKIGNNCVIKQGCYLEDVEIKDNVDIGPYARTRGGVIIENGVHIGNFGEIKNSTIGEGTKSGHFGYIGDATIGKKTNIGAGMVICNYDGKNKHHTKIGNNCFVGSNSTIISPCELEDNSYIAGGSVITDKVESYALGIGRARQENKKDWMKKKLELLNKKSIKHK